MRDYLLRFDDEAAAIALLPGLHGEEGWTGDVLAVVLVTADAVYGEPDEGGMPVVETPRAIEPGFWLLTTLPDQPGEVAAIERETGHIVGGDVSLAGARLDPVWAGGEPFLRIGDVVA